MRTLVFGVVVLVVAALVYANALRNGYALDDVSIVRDNDVVHGLGNLRSILLGPYWPNSAELYRPLALLSFALDWSLFGDNPAAMHAVNVALHATASLLVFLLAYRLAAPAVAALLAGLAFAIHPVHVEAVANLVGRAEILSAIFFLLACHLYITGRIRRVSRIAGAAGLYLLALGAKEIAVTLPAVLSLLVLFKTADDRRSAVHALRGELPQWCALGGTLALYLALRTHVLGRALGTEVAPYFVGLDPLDRLATAVRLWPEFLRLLFWPADLSGDWGPDVITLVGWTSPLAIGGLLLGLMIAGLAVLCWKEHRWVSLAVGWFAITFLPISHIPFAIGVMLAERTLYLPSVAVCLLAPAIWQAARRWRPALRAAALVGAAALAGLAVTRTWTRTPAWHSTESFFATLSAEHPESYWIAWQVANSMVQVGHVDQSMPWFAKAMARTRGNHYNLSMDYARALVVGGRPAEAEPLLRHWVRERPDGVPGYVYLTASLVDLGKYREALAMVDSALSTSPWGKQNRAVFYHLSALAYDGLGMLDSALVQRMAGLQSPESVTANDWLHLARLRSMLGQPQLAAAALDSARALAPPAQRASFTLDPIPPVDSPLIRGWGHEAPGADPGRAGVVRLGGASPAGRDGSPVTAAAAAARIDDASADARNPSQTDQS